MGVGVGGRGGGAKKEPNIIVYCPQPRSYLDVIPFR